MYRNFEEQDGYIRLKTKERSAICVPDILIDGRKAQECLITQAHSVLAHLGTLKTLAYLHDHV
jgi:hypothetical protein